MIKQVTFKGLSGHDIPSETLMGIAAGTVTRNYDDSSLIGVRHTKTWLVTLLSGHEVCLYIHYASASHVVCLVKRVTIVSTEAAQ